MKLLLVVLGIVIVVVGAVLLTVPLIPHPAQSIHQGQFYSYHATERVPVFSNLAVSLSWTSNRAVTVYLYVCSTLHPGGTTLAALCPGAPSPQMESGTSGSSSFSVPLNGGVALAYGPGNYSGRTVTVTVVSTSSTVGVGIVGLGGAVLVLGVLLGRSKKTSMPTAGSASEPGLRNGRSTPGVPPTGSPSRTGPGK